MIKISKILNVSDTTIKNRVKQYKLKELAAICYKNIPNSGLRYCPKCKIIQPIESFGSTTNKKISIPSG